MRATACVPDGEGVSGADGGRIDGHEIALRVEGLHFLDRLVGDDARHLSRFRRTGLATFTTSRNVEIHAGVQFLEIVSSIWKRSASISVTRV